MTRLESGGVLSADSCFMRVENWFTLAEKLSRTLGLGAGMGIRTKKRRKSFPPHQVSGPCSIFPTKEESVPFTPRTLFSTANRAASISRS